MQVLTNAEVVDEIDVEVTAPVTERRTVWAKITTPQPWRPTKPKEELIGYYAGRTKREGPFGQYDVIMVAVPNVGVLTAAGVKVIAAIDAGNVQLRTPIKLVFNGLRDVGRDRPMKDVDVFVDETFLTPITELPEIS